MRKPNVDIFEFIIADANIDPAETLFIDDNVHNIETAADLVFRQGCTKPTPTLIF